MTCYCRPLSPARGALVLQAASMIQSPLNVVKTSVFHDGGQDGDFAVNWHSAPALFLLSPYHTQPARPRAHSARQRVKQPSDHGDYGGGDKMISTTTGLIK